LLVDINFKRRYNDTVREPGRSLERVRELWAMRKVQITAKGSVSELRSALKSFCEDEEARLSGRADRGENPDFFSLTVRLKDERGRYKPAGKVRSQKLRYDRTLLTFLSQQAAFTSFVDGFVARLIQQGFSPRSL
jgi:hypothetical protein